MLINNSINPNIVNLMNLISDNTDLILTLFSEVALILIPTFLMFKFMSSFKKIFNILTKKVKANANENPQNSEDDGDNISFRTASTTTSEAREQSKKIQGDNLFEDDLSFFYTPEVKHTVAKVIYSASRVDKLPSILEESDTELDSEIINESESETELNKF